MQQLKCFPWHKILHVWALYAFGVLQPILQDFTSGALFADYGIAGDVIWGWFLTLTLLVPLASGLLLGMIAAWLPRFFERLYQALIFGLLLMLIIQAFNQNLTFAAYGVLVILAAAGAGFFVILLKKKPILHTYLTCLSPAILIFPLMFLLSPAREFMLPRAPERLHRTPSETPVVLIVFDELPATTLLETPDSIDPLRYPNFAQLAAQATWYPNTVTVHTETQGAVPAILTGKYPAHSGDKCLNRPQTASNHPDNLFTLLDNYDFKVRDNYTRLCHKPECREPQTPVGLPQILVRSALHLKQKMTPNSFVFRSMQASLEQFLQRALGLPQDGTLSLDNNIFFINHPSELNLLHRFLADIDRANRPATLYYLHLLFPHYPFQFTPAGTLYLESMAKYRSQDLCPDQPESVKCLPLFRARSMYQRHLMQAGYSDVLLGKILDRLKEEGIYYRALIIVTADHGIIFEPFRSYRYILDDEASTQPVIASVPLLIKFPQQAQGRIDKRFTETVDILPTIAQVLNRTLPWPADGVSVLSQPAPPRAGHPLCTPGQWKTFSARLHELKHKTLAEKTKLFGSGKTRPNGLFSTMAAYDHLIGRSAETLPTETRFRAEIFQPESFERVQKKPGLPLPLMIAGGIQPGGAETHLPAQAVAIVVNGRVAAITEAEWISERLGYQFQAMIPEASLQSGRNTVEALVLKPSGE